eukprot:1717221-Pyramimonas_sp.AAC.1
MGSNETPRGDQGFGLVAREIARHTGMMPLTSALIYLTHAGRRPFVGIWRRRRSLARRLLMCQTHAGRRHFAGRWTWQPRQEGKFRIIYDHVRHAITEEIEGIA